MRVDLATPHTSLTRLLIVDDNPTVLASLQQLLARPGYDVSLAVCGLDALKALNTCAFDLLVLDLVLPDISGLEVMQHIGQHADAPTVVAISGYDDIDMALGALKLGAYDFLRKTSPPEELVRTVDNAAHARRLKQNNQRIHDQLMHSEKIYRHLLDNSVDIIYTLDAQGCFTFINERVEPLLGWSPHALLGQHFSTLVHPDDREQACYVFAHGHASDRLSRHVEMQLQPHDPAAEPRLFRHEIMHVLMPEQANGATDSPALTRMRAVYGIAHDTTESNRANAQLMHQAYHDVLTDLPNRSLFKDRLGLALLQSLRNKTSVAVLSLDLDRFKQVNDNLGHDLGDELLRQTATRLKASLRRGDTLARLGDDEFTVILTELGHPQDVNTIALQCLTTLRAPYTLGDKVVHMSASMGIAVHPQHGITADALLKNADIAMYHQKANGKDGFAVFHEALRAPAQNNIALEHDLRLALQRDELEMYFQPQVDVKTQTVIGAEALMRWNHPVRGLLGPAEFLPLAEESGLILPMTDWMLESVCNSLVAWNLCTATPLRVSVNLSPQYLDRGGFVEKLRDALSRHQLSATQIEVEITENVCIRNPLSAIEQLNRLCQLGVSIAIDDFGTGYSSLSYLHRFPIHTLKIDRSFIMEIRDDTTPLPVVLAIVSIAKGLKLHLVAEGVETLMQQRYLADAGCNTVQGYFYHRPMPQKSLLALLDRKT